MTDENTVIEKDTETKKKADIPKKYKVVIYNDDYTSFEFVTDVLQRFFSKSLDESSAIAANVHKKGKDTIGHYPKNIADAKVAATMELASQFEFPLKLKVLED